MKNSLRFLVLGCAPLVASLLFASDVIPISSDTLLARMATHDASLIVLDVRTPEEFARGHVPGAKNIPYDELPARISNLMGDKNKDIVVYCQGGKRAAIALDTLQTNGFQKLLHLEGDMGKWIETKRPIEK